MNDNVYDLLKEMLMNNTDYYRDFKKNTLKKLKLEYKNNGKDNKIVRNLKEYVYNQRILTEQQKDNIWRKITND